MLGLDEVLRGDALGDYINGVRRTSRSATSGASVVEAMRQADPTRHDAPSSAPRYSVIGQVRRGESTPRRDHLAPSRLSLMVCTFSQPDNSDPLPS